MSYALLSETTPKARKEHRCIWCAETILEGERYRREKSIYDGNMQNHAWHLECSEAAIDEFNEAPEEDFAAGDNERPAARLGFENILICDPNINLIG